MKIIDKKKDYYDYLTGIYGIDEKLVLDRRDGCNIQYPDSYLRFYIAGYIIEGLCVDGQFYYGKDLDKFKIKDGYNGHYMSMHWHRDYDKSIAVRYMTQFSSRPDTNWIYPEPIIDKNKINDRFDCPILIDLRPTWREKKVDKFPLLKDFGINKFIPAETIYQWLSAWLGNQITTKEQSEPMTNNEKIISKGFDNKTSFRPKIK